MSTTPEQKDQIRQLFRKHVPEVADGLVEIVSIAREVGHKCYVAVRSRTEGADPDPVGACTVPRHARLKEMVDELNNEHFTVVRWENSPERFITNAVRHLDASNVALNPVTHEAVASIDRTATNNYFLGGWGTQELELRMISELTGWKVSLRSGQE